MELALSLVTWLDSETVQVMRQRWRKSRVDWGVCRGDGRTARGAGWTEHEEARLRTKGNPLLKAHPFRAIS